MAPLFTSSTHPIFLQPHGIHVATKKKHSKAEIASKLALADHLAKQGTLQSDIARTLEISVMTLHRWRKAPRESVAGSAATRAKDEPRLDDDQKRRIADLKLENSRLRCLVTDLLLEKMKLEEVASCPSPRGSVGR
jgi:transposase